MDDPCCRSASQCVAVGLLDGEDASPDRAAAAVAWVVAKANDTLQPHTGGLTATELVGWFGVSGSVSQWAAPMLEAVDAPSTHASSIRLGSPSHLVATTRARIIALRDAR